MGWFAIDEDERVILGDQVLDETYDFLRRVSDLYLASTGRRIRCEEMAALLEASLRVNADHALFAEFEERRVTALAIKTAGRSRRQSFKAGDLFAIPLNSGRFAFGRIMEAGGSHGEIVEVFVSTSSNAVPRSDTLKSGRLFHPVYFNGRRAFKDGAFKIVESDARYVPEDLGTLKFLVGVPGIYKIRSGSQYYPVSDEDADGVERAGLWEHESLTLRVGKALEAR